MSSSRPAVVPSALGRLALASISILVFASLDAPNSRADSHMSDEPSADAATHQAVRGTATDEPWRYSTDHFFALTRGLEEEDLSKTARRWVMVLTVPLDAMMVPTAAIAGLYGS